MKTEHPAVEQSGDTRDLDVTLTLLDGLNRFEAKLPYIHPELIYHPEGLLYFGTMLRYARLYCTSDVDPECVACTAVWAWVIGIIPEHPVLELGCLLHDMFEAGRRFERGAPGSGGPANLDSPTPVGR